ncbi:MAG: hypothetical protein H6R14_2380 [Proteobacteria bacterium]|nr:hypothetical protein [Pseudomonadota bacterium]
MEPAKEETGKPVSHAPPLFLVLPPKKEARECRQ